MKTVYFQTVYFFFSQIYYANFYYRPNNLFSQSNSFKIIKKTYYDNP